MPLVIPYVDQTWADGSGGGTPVSAARLNVIEAGIKAVSQGPFVQVSHNTTQSATSNVALALACNSENFDQAAGAASTMHDTVTNNSRLTCRYAGIYLIQADLLTWVSNPTNAVLAFRLNGATTFGMQQIVGDWRTMAGTAFRNLAVNDYVECMVTQVSGGALNMSANFEFGMVRVA